jgi:two-component system, NtrC family, sensor kinase
MSHFSSPKTPGNFEIPNHTEHVDQREATDRIQVDHVLAEMEKALNDIISENPRIDTTSTDGAIRLDDLKAILEVSLAINSSLDLEEILQTVMGKAVELLAAERGFIMLLDKQGNLQIKTAHNIHEDSSDESFRISSSIANQAASEGRSIYTSDAQQDERYANQQSVVELHLRSIMCVPLKIANKVIGVIYLDNSSQAKLFLKSDMYLFELYAQQAAMAIHNAQLYARLSRLKQYNEDIVAQSPVGIVVLDPEYHLVTVNDASLEIFQVNKADINLTPDHPQWSRFYDLIPENQYGAWRTMIETVLTGQGNFREDRFFHNTGYEEKVLSIKITPIASLPTTGTGAILVIEDITEKVILEKYVILSEKLVAKGEMAASIGHELNNFLTIISNNAELMQINIDRQEYEKAINNSRQVVENVHRIKRFTDGLMDFSKLETEMVKYDIRHLVDNLLFSIKTQRKFKGVVLDVALASDLPEISIDVGQIQQVLLNLLNNAVDAMQKTEKPRIGVDVRFDANRDCMIITVTDNGHGMPDDVRQKIFQAHFTTKATGHGLGLSNSRKIIVNHGGEISVESMEGVGTTFTIILPRTSGAA